MTHLEILGADIGYTTPILKGVEASLHGGELVALLGRNGSGKSTILRHIAGLHPTLRGSIQVNGQEVHTLGDAKRAKLISMVTPFRTRIAHLTASEAVSLGRAPYTGRLGRMTLQDRKIVQWALEQTGMADFAQRSLSRMSDGEYQRVMIARALTQDTPIILLDEPTAFLDLPNRYDLAILLQRLAHHTETPKLIIYSTHELDIAFQLSDQVMLIHAPHLTTLTTEEMRYSAEVKQLFSSSSVYFDPETGQVRLLKKE